MTKYGLTKKQKLILLLGITFTIFILVGVLRIFSLSKDEYSSMNLSEGWKITIGEQIYDNITLNQLTFPEVNKGELVIMKMMLPDAPYTYAQLRIFTCDCAMRVYLDGNEIYQYGMERMKSNLFLGKGYHFVELPSDYAQKELTIEYYITENNSFCEFSPVTLSNTKDSIPLFLIEHRLQLFVGSYLMLFGISFLIITIVMIGYELNFIKMFQISIVSILIGLWTLANSSILQLFLPRISLCTILEYLTIYLAPIPLMLYFYDEIKTLRQRFLRILYWVLTIGLWGFDIIVLALQALNLNHIPNSHPYFYMTIVIIAIYVFVLMMSQVRKKELSSRIQMLGMMIVITCVGFDLMRYFLEKYSLTYSNEFFVAIFPIGVFIFVIFMLISFCIDVSQNVHNKVKQEVLLQQAYMDHLTSIPNRRYCEETMEMLEHIPEGVPYGILSIDINNLKEVNDSLGHDKGDCLITIVANIIYHTFHEFATVGRMGGDEFIVLVPDARGFQLNVHLNKLLEDMKRKNELLTDFQISISYGYATSWEVEERTVKNVYNLADSRMYQYKKRFKIVHTK